MSVNSTYSPVSDKNIESNLLRAFWNCCNNQFEIVSVFKRTIDFILPAQIFCFVFYILAGLYFLGPIRIKTPVLVQMPPELSVGFVSHMELFFFTLV